MKNCFSAIFAVVALSASTVAMASDLPKAQYLAANCANCHGTNGNSAGGMASLAGYDKVKFVETMKAFQSGKRPATIMHQLSKGYTDAQIESMAAYFAAQKPAN